MKLNLIYLIIISSILFAVKTTSPDTYAPSKLDDCDDQDNGCPVDDSQYADIRYSGHSGAVRLKIHTTTDRIKTNPDQITDNNNESDINIISNTTTTTTPPTLLKKLLSRFKIYYGDNDRPVTQKIASIKSYLTRFGYIDHVKRLFRKNIQDRHMAHKKRRTKRFKYRITFAQLLRDDIKSMADVVKTAIKMYQKFMRLNVTGYPNTATLLKMNRPRCGGKDMGEQRVEPTYMTLKQKIRNFMSNTILGRRGRRKRHTLAGSRWLVTNITYKTTRYPTKFRDKRHLIDEQISKAFKLWSEVTPLVFTRLSSLTHSRDVVIDIRFERGEHGDGDPLDGAGKVLAHSYFPQYGGDAHFDDDEIWTLDSAEGSNILITAIHEFGHSLGLDHSDVTNSIMNPVYPNYTPGQKVALHQDDIRAIQVLYGSKTGIPDIPNLCLNASVDAMHKELNSCAIFVFKGKHYWKIKSDEMTIDSQYPRPISELFPGIEADVNAVIQMPDLSHIVFKGENCYKYNDNLELEDGFPIKIKDLFYSLPTNMDSAIRLDRIIYGFKGGLYWKFIIDDEDSSSVKQSEPQPIGSKWPGVPSDFNAVLSIKHSIYFFKDQGFYRLNKFEDHYKLTNGEPPYPRKTSLWWFGCQ